MSLKRKRSSSELCSSPISSVSSTYSSPPSRRHATVDFAPCPMLSNPAHLHSRTMKRYRDNRPSEEEIHQRTLGMLFSAQQQQRDEQSISEMASPAEAVVQQSQATSNQQSLHRFWNIASQPTAVQEAAMSEPEQAACLPSFPAEEGGYIQSTLDQTQFVRHTMT